MNLGFVILFVFFFSVSAQAADEKMSANGVWKERNSKGVVVRTSRDTNSDGNCDGDSNSYDYGPT